MIGTPRCKFVEAYNRAISTASALIKNNIPNTYMENLVN